MRIAAYFDLPDGGARYATYKILEKLSESDSIDIYTFGSSASLTDFSNIASSITEYRLPNFVHSSTHIARLLRDLYAVLLLPILESRVAKTIDRGEYDAVIVSHTRFLQAPSILRFLTSRVVFLCQEPTRAFFEADLFPLSDLPLPNRLYESVIRYLKKTLEIHNARAAIHTIANSEFASKQISRAYGVEPFIVHLGVDTNTFYPEPKSNRGKYVLAIGNDEPQKNLRLAVDTISVLPEKTRPSLHIISPRDNVMQELVSYAREHKVRLEVSSRISQSNIRELYSSALCTLAVARREPFGLSALESMACGTPVVAIDQGGFRETVIDGVTGYLCSNDPHNLASGIERVDNIKSKDCISHVRECFSWDLAAKNIRLSYT